MTVVAELDGLGGEGIYLVEETTVSHFSPAFSDQRSAFS
jgi:hypothetical protein